MGYRALTPRRMTDGPSAAVPTAALSSPALREARKGSGSTTSTRGTLTTSWCPSSAQRDTDGTEAAAL